MRSPEIRERFLNYFQNRGHHRLASASLVTHDDPSVLFTVAGMVPLKPYILGLAEPPASRVCSCQKCFRGSGMRDDVAEVGDTTHHTFFEMLGNWSFGDYFKEGAIEMAWELLTTEFALPADRLWPSVYPDDAVAERLWVEHIGVPRERVAHLHENWWQAGPTGPCGYDSEVYFDRGGPCSCGRPACTPQDECGGDRWVEIWNLVFMEFDQTADGARHPLPRRCVDTGMGLERMAAVLQGVRSNYQTDLFAPLVADLQARADDGPPSPRRTASFNVLADHLRSSSFLVADGVLPGNEGRGYALRRVIRRAGVHARRVGLRGGLADSVPALVGVMGDAYPELAEHRDLVVSTLRAEEEAFARTVADGSERLDALLGDGATTLGGDDAFRLHDTYGFPIDLTVELARERGADVDVSGFARAMERQRERSRESRERVGFGGGEVPELPPTTFVGYEVLSCPAEVVWVDDAGARAVIEPSPFYAESGGQVGDRGSLAAPRGDVEVVDCQLFAGTQTRVLSVEPAGRLRPGDRVTAVVDEGRRAATARHHSATHLLHRALREVLGPAAAQRGSWVGPDHTTFDFAFSRALTDGELREVEHLVNSAIRDNLERTATVMPVAEARAAGAVALFGEKYGDQVRVVDFGGWSRELCGGTHVARSGDIGAALLLSESSIGSGVRRIDMVAGEAAERRWSGDLDALRQAAAALRARPEEVPERVATLQAQVRRLQRQVEEERRRAVSGGGATAATVELVDGVRLAHSLVDGDRDAVVAAVDTLFADRLQGDGVALALGERAVAVKVGGAAATAGVHAGRLVRLAAETTGGRGGGRADFANGGVGDPALRQRALDEVRRALAGARAEQAG